MVEAFNVALLETLVRVPVKLPGARAWSKTKPLYVPFPGRELRLIMMSARAVLTALKAKAEPKITGRTTRLFQFFKVNFFKGDLLKMRNECTI